MKSNHMWAKSLAFSLLMAIASVGFAATPAASVDIEQKIQTAKTPADHEAIASYYSDEASAARAQADQHAKMSKLYLADRANSKTLGHVYDHCAKIVKQYQSLAANYDAIAEAHHKAAKEATKP